MRTAVFAFHGELGRFIAPVRRARAFAHPFPPGASVKHMIEALGVPHTEVDAILADGTGVDFSHPLRQDERIDVYPHGFPLDARLRLPLRPPHSGRFVADAHLGRLARNLRMLGIDVLYRNDFGDADLARLAALEQRVALTRDRDLLIRKEIVHGCFVHGTREEAQLAQVLRRFDLMSALRPFSRCLCCNEPLRRIGREAASGRVPDRSFLMHEQYYECRICLRVYWHGSHVERMRVRMERMLAFEPGAKRQT